MVLIALSWGRRFDADDHFITRPGVAVVSHVTISLRFITALVEAGRLVGLIEQPFLQPSTLS